MESTARANCELGSLDRDRERCHDGRGARILLGVRARMNAHCCRSANADFALAERIFLEEA